MQSLQPGKHSLQACQLAPVPIPCHPFRIFLRACGPIAIARQAEALQTKYAAISIALSASYSYHGHHLLMLPRLPVLTLYRWMLCLYPGVHCATQCLPSSHPWHQVTCCLSLFIHASLAHKSFLVSSQAAQVERGGSSLSLPEAHTN